MSRTLIVGLYMACELIANVMASTPIVLSGGLALPGGIFPHVLTFTLLDIANERLGEPTARRMVYATFVACAILAGYAYLVAVLARNFSLAWTEVPDHLAATPRIVVAGLLAYLAASLVDVRIFAWWRRYVRGPRRGAGTAAVLCGVLASNTVSTLIDSIVFVGIAFGLVVSQDEMGLVPVLIVGQYAVKMGITLLSLPLIYAIRERSILC